MPKKYRVVHYINQFFGQIGGEDRADVGLLVKEGPIGPGLALQSAYRGRAEISVTIICGDNYFARNMKAASAECVEVITQYQPDIEVAGPAFGAGRYGMACGAVSQAVVDHLQLPVVTAMFPENPAVDSFRQKVYILPTGNSATSMRAILPKLAEFSLKLASGQELGFPEEEGYLPQGYRVNVFADKTGAVRAVEMLMAKMAGRPFTTELPVPVFDRVPPVSALKDLKKATIALVTSGGIVPKGNPDQLPSHNASKFARYNISNVSDMTEDEYESVHGGYDIVYANEDPDRVLPLDVMRQLEAEGIIGKLYDYYYSTVGNTTAVSSATRFGNAIGEELRGAGVDAVILTST